MISEPKHISSTEASNAALRPFTVGIDTHQPATDRAHQEAHGEDSCGVQQLGGHVALGKNAFAKYSEKAA